MKFLTKQILIAVAAAAIPFSVHAADADNNIELAFLPSAMDVTLLNEGGKFVTVDMKKLAKGDKCHLDKDAVIMKVGPGAAPATTRVRFAAPNLSHGGCPFMTEFELPDADYTAARAAFTAKTDEASKKIDDLKKQLGDKWNELTTQKKE
ncbi:hypothetical protein [Hyphomicrobium facile]|uniref:Uncharacterized protein n=1 Tax=Hyphomicrobium facile TaxID=51670 RepID=A0A1I7MX69_9HYPH|nr:hypothetical protein [Hyphomicrobium facile]SFV26936.1 hypothetical protein SAMN04488557_0637 [Hyphomicrobium facile]